MQMGGAHRLARRPLPQRHRRASGASCSSPARPPAWPPSSARRSAPRSSPSRCSIATTSSPTRSCRPSSRASSRYSVFISFFGERRSSRTRRRYPFVPAHLPLYALLAVVVSLVASGFLVDAARGAAATGDALRVPAWCKPALGGLALGLFATPHHHAHRAAPRAARAGPRHPRRRLRRRAARDHRRGVVPARLARRRAPRAARRA